VRESSTSGIWRVFHAPTVLQRDLRVWSESRDRVLVGRLEFRGACLMDGCGWMGAIRGDHEDAAQDAEDQAVEDANDHTHPGWRELPAVPDVPDEQQKVSAWRSRVRELYPPGWVDQP